MKFYSYPPGGATNISWFYDKNKGVNLMLNSVCNKPENYIYNIFIAELKSCAAAASDPQADFVKLYGIKTLKNKND